MISRETIQAFSHEIVKLSSAKTEGIKLTKAKAGALLGIGGGLGMVGEQGKDDLMAGRRSRQAQARSMGTTPFAL